MPPSRTALPAGSLPSTVAPVALPHAYRLLNHGPTVLVSAAHNGQRNLMAAAWNMPLDFDPPKVAVVIDKSTFTRGLVEASGRFALNLPPVALADATLTVGSVSARDGGPATQPDKFTALNLPTWQATPDGPPLLQGCVGWLVCKVLPQPELQQAHDLFLAQVESAWADTRVFAQGKYLPVADIPPELRTLHHLGAGVFVSPGWQWQARQLEPVTPSH